MPPTRSALQERLFNEARRYNEKANVVDHVADRMNFIDTGLVELPHERKRISIACVTEAARRTESAARSINFGGSRFIAELRRRARSMMPDGRMLESVKTLVKTVEAWTRLATEPAYERASTEYNR
jgi:hypothetical protein